MRQVTSALVKAGRCCGLVERSPRTRQSQSLDVLLLALTRESYLSSLLVSTSVFAAVYDFLMWIKRNRLCLAKLHARGHVPSSRAVRRRNHISGSPDPHFLGP